MTLPISFEEALAARERLRPYLQPTPLRSYEALDEEIGAGIRVLVKHENRQLRVDAVGDLRDLRRLAGREPRQPVILPPERRQDVLAPYGPEKAFQVAQVGEGSA